MYVYSFLPISTDYSVSTMVGIYLPILSTPFELVHGLLQIFSLLRIQIFYILSNSYT